MPSNREPLALQGESNTPKKNYPPRKKPDASKKKPTPPNEKPNLPKTSNPLKKKSKKPPPVTATSSMYPNLDSEVQQLLAAEGLAFSFHKDDTMKGCIDDYDTNIMGRFVCHNKACKKGGWSSKVIPITIRLYPNQRYNARVYHQRCKSCDSLSRPKLDDSYSERIAYRLQRWSGIDMEPPPYEEKQHKKPHEKDFCEGCKAGHCTWWTYSDGSDVGF